MCGADRSCNASIPPCLGSDTDALHAFLPPFGGEGESAMDGVIEHGDGVKRGFDFGVEGSAERIVKDAV